MSGYSTKPWDPKKYRDAEKARNEAIERENAKKAEELHKDAIERGRLPSEKTGHHIKTKK